MIYSDKFDHQPVPILPEVLQTHPGQFDNAAIGIVLLIVLAIHFFRRLTRKRKYKTLDSET